MKTRESPFSAPLFIAGILLIVLSQLVSFPGANAQNCVMPDTQARSTAFSQGQQITVHVNENQFTQSEFNCLVTAFNNWNNANSSNTSGVQFNVTRSPTVLVTSNASGVVTSGGTNVYQVNRSTDAVAGVAVTGGQGTSSNRVNAFTNIHPNVTNCTALAQTMAHEIGHTLGLGECTNCTAAQQSVMVGVPCLQTDANNNCISIDYNNTTYGLSGPNACDNNAVHQSGYGCTNHNPANCEGQGFTWDEYSCTCNTCYCNSPEHSSWCSEEEMRCTNDGRIFEWCQGLCTYYSPIIIDVAGNGFSLTNAANGVFFDINADTLPERISWTAPNSDDGFLALDRNGNGQIDDGKELFGNFTLQPDPLSGEEKNGFRALAEYDQSQNGGNEDGVITSDDSIFNQLRLWHDLDHNGVAENSELKSLTADRVLQISLDYKESKRTDNFGNRFRYRAKVTDAHGAQLGRWAWDVFLQRN